MMTSRSLSPRANPNAVIAHIRHRETESDCLLARGYERHEQMADLI
jgi:hypothetical protein